MCDEKKQEIWRDGNPRPQQLAVLEGLVPRFRVGVGRTLGTRAVSDEALLRC